MTEVCINGHTRTEQNTSLVKCGRGDKRKRVCLDCRKLRNSGKPAAHELQAQRTTELHEDIEDLLKFGASFQEIIQRSGYSSWERMRRSLKSRGRDDLIEKLKSRSTAAHNEPLIPRGIGEKKRKGKNVMPHGKAHKLPRGLEFDWSGYSLQTPA